MQKHPVSKAAVPHKPFLKWVGGKSRVLHHVLPKLPTGQRLIEPFVGGGAVFLGADYERYVLGDSNGHLIELYREVSKRPQEFAAAAAELFTESNLSQDRYSELRALFNSEQDPLARAALFLYLNKFGFNGLCRYNRAGLFNVPYGHPTRTPKLPVAEIFAFAQKATNATFVHCDFIELMMSAKLGDVVYCDPPYLDTDNASSFKAYGASGFDFNRQRDLADCARDLASRGIPVVVSNHDCVAARDLYAGAELHAFTARRSVSAAGDRRGHALEILAVFGA
jgi:DNA adenine methylase